MAALVLAGRQAALERGVEDTAALSVVIEQLTARTFQAVYLTLSAVADALKSRAYIPSLPASFIYSPQFGQWRDEYYDVVVLGATHWRASTRA